jgi:hypothetical protein
MTTQQFKMAIELQELFCNKTGLSIDDYYKMLDAWYMVKTEIEQFEKLFLTQHRDVPRLDRVYSLLCFRMNKFEQDYKIKCCPSVPDAIKNYEPPSESI